MRRILGVFGLLALTLAASADRVDDLSRKLTHIERRYWQAVSEQPAGEFRRETQVMILDAEKDAREIQTVLKREEVVNVPNVQRELAEMRMVFDSTASYKIFADLKTNFKPTSLSEYEREYRRYMSNRGESRPPPPTLANINLTHYENWLEEVTVNNRDSYSLRGSNKNRKDPTLRRAINTYFSSLKTLRITLARLRQSQFTFP